MNIWRGAQGESQMVKYEIQLNINGIRDACIPNAIYLGMNCPINSLQIDFAIKGKTQLELDANVRLDFKHVWQTKP